MYFVYVLKSLRDNKYYIGQTNDFERRVRQHMLGRVASTKNRRPFRIVGSKMFKTRSESMRMEHQLKLNGEKKREFIDKIIKERPTAFKASGPEGGE